MKIKFPLFLAIFILPCNAIVAQILYVPYNGTGTSLNSNVGIGTSAPSSKLYVQGGEIGTDGNLRLFGSNPYIYSNGFNNPIRIEAQSVILQGHGGNVGIGTLSPGEALTVKGTSLLGIGTYGDGLDGSLKQRFVLASDATYGNIIDGAVKADGTRLPIYIKWRGDYSLTMSAITILGNRNVGIGCSNPSSKLTVNGKIIAQEVEVINPVPSCDFVFESDYKQLSISSLEKFIKTNKHLPGVPSAEEFKKSGYNLALMDNALLKNVEDLSLYVIELEKKIRELEIKVKELESK